MFYISGGTIDTTVHKVLASGDLQEVHKATGGDWGATRVDDQFEEFMGELFGHDVYKAFIDLHKYDQLDLMEDFEVKKRSVTYDMDNVTIKIPHSLLQMYRDMNPDLDLTHRISSLPKYCDKIKILNDKLKIDSDIIKELFASSCDEIVSHLRNLVTKSAVKDAKTILMVGGFSESPILQEEIRSHFPENTLIIPSEPSLAVVKGAVLYGHDPWILESRICKLTYGIATNMPFEADLDADECAVYDETGDRLCANRFSVHVKIGQQLDSNAYQTSHIYRVLRKEQKDLRFHIYTSRSDNPRYTTEPDCELLGQLILKMPNTNRGTNRTAIVKMKFGGTELVVSAKDPVTGKKVDSKLKFLE